MNDQPIFTIVLLLVHGSATLFMTGIIWFVQVVHYPLFNRVGREGFAVYERSHTRLTGRLLAGPMLVELIAAALIAGMLGGTLAWTGLGILALIWASTRFLQVPEHRRLEQGFDPAAHRRLVQGNWLRTVAWTARAIIALLLLITPQARLAP